MKHIILTLVLAISSSWAVAQTSDSTLVNLPMTLLPNVISSNGATVSSMIKSGTMCGTNRDGIKPCDGHNPAVSCPSGYYRAWYGWRGEGMFTCVKS